MEARFSQLLEDATGVEHLNFGTSGSFGTIQEWILYRDLARQFDHTDVMVFILPANDFSDNNPADFPPTRYRPYLRPAGTSFELFSSVSFANRQREFRDWGMTIKNGIDNASHLANYLRFAVREVKERARLSAPPPSPKEPSYARSTDQDRDILIHSLEQIIALAGARRVYLFTIPAEDDFAHAAARGTSDLPLPWELIKLASRHENVTYADLLPAFVRHARDNGLTHADYVLACDAHWNRLGHQVAADAIQRVVFAGGATSLKEPTP
jgi:hypothetical protein